MLEKPQIHDGRRYIRIDMWALRVLPFLLAWHFACPARAGR